jgi:hypothetical protein
MTRKLEELAIYTKAVTFWSAVEEQLKQHLEPGEQLGKMLGGFIKYLRECDWDDRGHHHKKE